MIYILVTLFVGVLAAVVSIYIGVWRPREDERKQLLKEKIARDKYHDQVLDGVTPIPGLTIGAQAIALRTAELEETVKGICKEMSENTGATYTMSLRQNQANGKVAEIYRMVTDIVSAVSELAGRPLPATNEKRAADKRDVIEAINQERAL